MKYQNRQNPFLTLFIVFALLCSLLLSIEFFSFFHNNHTRLQEEYYQKKAKVLMSDLELHLENLHTMTFRFSTDVTYKYSVLTEKKYNENLLLEDFSSHKYDCSLTDELFLHYGGENIYHVKANTISLDVYLPSLTGEEEAILTKALNHPGTDSQIISAAGNLYIITPFKVGYGNDAPWATLTAVVTFDQLEERFQIISGGLGGTISLYAGDTLLYSNQEKPCSRTTKNVLSASILNDRYTLCYLPARESISIWKLLLEVCLILIDMLLVLLIARVFAASAYRPLQKIRNKYQPEDVQPQITDTQDVFSEIEGIIDTALLNHKTAEKSVAQKQEQLKQEVLKQLLNKTYSQDIQAELDTLSILLPGPFYYVISLSFARTNVEEDVLHLLKKDLEQTAPFHVAEPLHIVCDSRTKQLWIICNLPGRAHKPETTEFVRMTAEKYASNILLGSGKIYDDPEKISASWLESIDNMDNHGSIDSSQSKTFIYDFSDLQQLEQSLSGGLVENALIWLSEYVDRLESQNLSLLMQQYIFTNFIGTLNKLSKRNGITLSSQNLSLIISARNISSFHEAAQELITEYCEKLQCKSEALKNDQHYQICRYINEHFMEYDISIELIAENLGVTTATVRDAVLKSTGKMYKDYLVFLRMEYAKELLQEGEMSVAEVSNAVGYNSVSYFIRLFKNIYSVTPAKFVKKP